MFIRVWPKEEPPLKLDKFHELYRKGDIYIYIYTNLPVNAIVRLPHPQSGDSQGQETFLADIHIYKESEK